MHYVDLSLPVRRPWRWPSVTGRIRALIQRIGPDLIHSHFLTTTLALRVALGPSQAIPMIFQVPGPLHLEHHLFRALDLWTGRDRDYWVAASRYTQDLYAESGVPSERVYLSYHGSDVDRFDVGRRGRLRERLGIGADARIVGNVSYIYPPKYFLGQTIGLKAHEDVIDALGVVCAQRPDVIGVLIGGQWSGGDWYERRLRRRARRVAGDRIIFLGRVAPQTVPHHLADLDLVVHVPISENCGGVSESLAARVPTIASSVGGIPEVVFDGTTGWLVPPRRPTVLAETILEVLSRPAEAHRRAVLGHKLVRIMLDIERTARTMAEIYRHIIDGGVPPAPFDSEDALTAIQLGTMEAT
jgi:glycosyltransferase involved in cell wall biosynthesis